MELRLRFVLMSGDSLGSISVLFEQLQQGDATAAHEVWSRYFPRLAGLARRILSNRQLPQGAEDAVQDAFFKFFRRVERGDYESGLRRDDLWRTLSLITVQAARKLMIRESAQRRGSGKVFTETDMVGGNGNHRRFESAFGRLSTAECDIICSEFLQRLDGPLREVAILRLAGYTNPEIKSILGCSLRSVERQLYVIRATWCEYVD